MSVQNFSFLEVAEKFVCGWGVGWVGGGGVEHVATVSNLNPRL